MMLERTRTWTFRDARLRTITDRSMIFRKSCGGRPHSSKPILPGERDIQPEWRGRDGGCSCPAFLARIEDATQLTEMTGFRA